MLTYVGIIVGCICLIAIAIGGYMIHSRMLSQTREIERLSARQVRLEGIVSRPPPKQELLSIFEKTKISKCEDDDCDIRPIRAIATDHDAGTDDEDGGDLKSVSDPPPNC